MLAWRDDFGNESHWAAALGNRDRRARRRGILAARRFALNRPGRMTARDSFAPSTRSACRRNARRCARTCARSSPRRWRAGTFDPHATRPRRPAQQASSAVASARKGWIGMTWPKKYGGHERSFLERYVVTEEFRVAERAGAAAFRRRPPERPDPAEICARAHQDGHPAAHLPRRGLLRDRHERAGLGLGPVRRQDQGDEDRRRLADQRHQDLDQQRAHRRLHARPVPHLAADQGEPPPRADPVPGRHEDARHHG